MPNRVPTTSSLPLDAKGSTIQRPPRKHCESCRCTFLLVIAVGIYDLATRRRLHPAYVFGANVASAEVLLASLCAPSRVTM
jgi:hypothetical protein